MATPVLELPQSCTKSLIYMYLCILKTIRNLKVKMFPGFSFPLLPALMTANSYPDLRAPGWTDYWGGRTPCNWAHGADSLASDFPASLTTQSWSRWHPRTAGSWAACHGQCSWCQQHVNAGRYRPLAVHWNETTQGKLWTGKLATSIYH